MTENIQNTQNSEKNSNKRQYSETISEQPVQKASRKFYKREPNWMEGETLELIQLVKINYDQLFILRRVAIRNVIWQTISDVVSK